MGKSPVELVIQVYDGAIASFNQATEHYNQKNLNEGWEQLEKAKKFITHLYTTLDEDKGGEIAHTVSVKKEHSDNGGHGIECFSTRFFAGPEQDNEG